MRRLQLGFTIIEVMLFMVISALMVSLIIFGSTNSLRSGQYRDSVLSLQEFIQTQYSKTIFTQNSISANFSCVFSGSVLSISSGSGTTTKGQSNCLLLGRYLTTSDSNDGKSIKAFSVVGQKNQSSSRLDLDSLKNDYAIDYDVNNVTNTSETYNLIWNTFMKNKDGTTKIFSALILRSPNNGNVFSLISNGSVKTISELLNDANATAIDLILCLNNPGSGNMMGVKITSNSSNPTGVIYLGDGDKSGACS